VVYDEHHESLTFKWYVKDIDGREATEDDEQLAQQFLQGCAGTLLDDYRKFIETGVQAFKELEARKHQPVSVRSSIT
jgi:hypothetical protein